MSKGGSAAVIPPEEVGAGRMVYVWALAGLHGCAGTRGAQEVSDGGAVGGVTAGLIV